MGTLEYIQKKYKLRLDQPSPIEIPNMNRNNLAELFAELGFTVGAEIGTWHGEYAEDLCRLNSRLMLYCIDPWEVYQGYTDFKKQERVDDYYERAIERLARFNVRIVKKYSTAAMGDFADGSLDFVYVDANHDYAHVIEDIHGWSPKVKSGGIVAGHDYRDWGDRPRRGSHVKYAVDGYAFSYGIKPWFLVGRTERLRGEIWERYKTWFWVKA